MTTNRLINITITGKNSLVEQLLAEELTKRGFSVQIINETSVAKKGKWQSILLNLFNKRIF